VIDPDGHLLFTRTNIMAGQASFLRNGLMEYGSIFGHGAYLGRDFTADYLHRAALLSIDFYTSLGTDRARAATINDYKTNRYDSARIHWPSLTLKPMASRSWKSTITRSLPNRPQNTD
jgi:nitric oxide reductase large subunit